MLGDGVHKVAAGKLVMAKTRLQMTAPVPLRHVDPLAGVSFHKINDVDPAAYRDLFSRVGKDWLWYSRLSLGDDWLTEHFAQADIDLYTLRLNGRNEALLELSFREPDTCELAYFGLTAKLIGTGAGRYLMNRAIELAWTRPITRFHLHTCNYDSPQALDFYFRSGFTAYAREVEIDDDPRVLGLLPETAAPHVPLIRP